MAENAAGESEQAAQQAADVAQVDAEDDDLAEGLASLARLSVIGTSLEDVLTDIASYAVRAIPRADGAGLTLLEAGRADTIVKTTPFVKLITTSSTALAKDRALPLLRRVNRFGPGR